MTKTLKEAYKNYFTIGAAVSSHWFDEAKDLIKAQFDTVTCENEMKYTNIHPHEIPLPDFEMMHRGEKPDLPEIKNREAIIHPNGDLNTAPADMIYDFAVENGIKLRGHTLAWHGSYPWGAYEQLTPSELRTNLKEHFSFIAERYKNAYCWDVVNEAQNDRREGDDLRQSVFREKLGDDYLYELYALAREYFPDALLCLNDYSEFRPDKRDRFLRTAYALKERRLVDVVGLQCHSNVGLIKRGFDGVRRGLDMYAKTGLRIHITELDVSAIDWHEHADITPERLRQIPIVYGELFKIFREYKDVIDNVTFWGISSAKSWLNFMGPPEKRQGGNEPLPFDENYQPNESYLRIVDFSRRGT